MTHLPVQVNEPDKLLAAMSLNRRRLSWPSPRRNLFPPDEVKLPPRASELTECAYLDLDVWMKSRETFETPEDVRACAQPSASPCRLRQDTTYQDFALAHNARNNIAAEALALALFRTERRRRHDALARCGSLSRDDLAGDVSSVVIRI